MVEPTSDVWRRWIAEARDGDREAFNRLLAACAQYIRAKTHQRSAGHTRQQADDSDIVQETLLEAFRDFCQFSGDNQAEFLGWLRQVLAHNLADHVRQQCASKRSIERHRYLEEIGWPNLPHEQLSTTDDSTPSAIARHHETEAELLSAINRLPPDYRMVVALRQFGAMRFPEISALMGRSEAAVRKLWLRSLQQLADALARVR